MNISGSSLFPCSFIYCHKGGYAGIEEPNSTWPDWFNLVPALVSLSSIPLSTTPPVASVHYLQQLYVVVSHFECSRVSSQRGPQSRALPLVGPIPCQYCPLRQVRVPLPFAGWMTICSPFYTLLSITLYCGSWWILPMRKAHTLTDETGSMSVHTFH